MSDDLTRLTDEERGQLNCDCYRDWKGYHSDSCMVPVVKSILAARTAALIDRLAVSDAETAARQAEVERLIDRAERAEMERDEARQAHAELMQVAGEKYEALRDRAKAAAALLTDEGDNQ